MASISNGLNRNKFEKLKKEEAGSLKKAFSRIDEQELIEDLLPNSSLSQFTFGDLLRQTGVVFAPYAPLHVTTQVREVNHVEVNASEVKRGYRGIINKIVEILRDGSYNE